MALNQEKEDAKACNIASKAEEKVQRQLAKEEKERILVSNHTIRATKKKEKEDAKALKKREREEEKEARYAAKQLQKERKLIQERQKVKKVVFTIPNKPTAKEIYKVEDGVVKTASGRPQRVRKLPQHLKDSVITID